jgi:hypothetical protein
MFEASPKSLRDYFKSEETILTQLNPFFLAELLPLYLEKLPAYLTDQSQADPSYLAHIANNIVYTILIFQDDMKSGVIPTLYSLLNKILNFAEQNLAECTKNGTIKHLLNNTLIKMMVQRIDYDSPSNSYNNQMKMLLEVHLKLQDLQDEVNSRGLGHVYSNLQHSEGILMVKRGKTILQDK